MNGPIGAASAMKMSYAGITKGFTALGSMMMLAAARGGVAEGLRAELERSQPALLPWLQRLLRWRQRTRVSYSASHCAIVFFWRR